MRPVPIVNQTTHDVRRLIGYSVRRATTEPTTVVNIRDARTGCHIDSIVLRDGRDDDMIVFPHPVDTPHGVWVEFNHLVVGALYEHS